MVDCVNARGGARRRTRSTAAMTTAWVATDTATAPAERRWLRSIRKRTSAASLSPSRIVT